MLLIDVVLKLSVKKGTNLAEQHEVGRKVYQTQSGQETRPILAYTYIVGGQLTNLDSVLAPIDLLAGDVVRVSARAGQVIYVQRGPETIWINNEYVQAAEQTIEEKREWRKGKIKS